MSLCYTLSDVAGGYSSSMLDAMRRALDLSKILGTMDQDYHSLTFEEVFRLATLGGSQGQTYTSVVKGGNLKDYDYKVWIAG